MNPQIFREYDIRGIVGEDLTPETVELIGKAVGTYLVRKGGQIITLGRDVRASSIEFRDILAKALCSTGINVIDIGLVPTPVAYFSLHHFNSDGGVMITGSHNPPEFNGFKISDGIHSLYGEKIQELLKMIQAKDFDSGNGVVREEAVLEAYMEKIAESVKISRPVKVVVDGGNGCFGITGPQLLKKMGQSPIEIFCEPDGTFPNHHPDPTIPKYMQGLMDKVKSEQAELGIGFDGDADRIGVVDEKGNLLWGDQLLILFARDVLKSHPGAAIVGEVKCSQTLFDDIKLNGGNPQMAPAGHSLIKKKMRETNALLAGEMSGHICFKDRYYGFDDSLYAAARILEIVANSDQPVSEMLANVPKTYSTPEIRVDCPDDQKFEIVKQVTEHFRKLNEVVDIDGVRIIFDEGWGLIRASNTQPVLVFRFEAQSAETLESIKSTVKDHLVQYAPLKDLDI